MQWPLEAVLHNVNIREGPETQDMHHIPCVGCERLEKPVSTLLNSFREERHMTGDKEETEKRKTETIAREIPRLLSATPHKLQESHLPLS